MNLISTYLGKSINIIYQHIVLGESNDASEHSVGAGDIIRLVLFSGVRHYQIRRMLVPPEESTWCLAGRAVGFTFGVRQDT